MNPATRALGGAGNGSAAASDRPVRGDQQHLLPAQRRERRLDEVVRVDVQRALGDVHDRVGA